MPSYYMEYANDFKTWLVSKGYVTSTLRYFLAYHNTFMSWLASQQHTIDTLTYAELLPYIGYLQSKNLQKSTINKHLRIIELYYNYLQKTDYPDIANIALNVRVRGVEHPSSLLLTESELLEIYTNYQSISTTKGYYEYSNQLLLGLFIFQGVCRQTIYQLELAHLDLDKGRIYLPSGRYTKNSRVVPLEGHQVFPFHQYITKYRGIGMNRVKKTTTSNQLFYPNAAYLHRLNGQLHLLNTAIKTQFNHLAYQGLSQLSHSRISLWIERYGLRKAQYLSGHKGVDGIERYKNQNMEKLTAELQKFHPLQ